MLQQRHILPLEVKVMGILLFSLPQTLWAESLARQELQQQLPMIMREKRTRPREGVSH